MSFISLGFIMFLSFGLMTRAGLRLQEHKTAFPVFDAGYISADNFIENDLANEPGGDPGPQAPAHGLP